MSKTLTENEMWQASADFIYRKIADVDVLISVGGNVADFNGYIELNDSAVVLWQALQTPVTVERLAGVLVDTYGMDLETALSDTKEFLELLWSRNMVVSVHGL